MSPSKKKDLYFAADVYLSETNSPPIYNIYGAQEPIPRNEFRQPM